MIKYFFVCLIYISIKPDNQKLANRTNVFGLLIDTLSKKEFYLVSSRIPAFGDKKWMLHLWKDKKSSSPWGGIKHQNQKLPPSQHHLKGDTARETVKGKCSSCLEVPYLEHVCQPELYLVWLWLFSPICHLTAGQPGPSSAQSCPACSVWTAHTLLLQSLGAHSF